MKKPRHEQIFTFAFKEKKKKTHNVNKFSTHVFLLFGRRNNYKLDSCPREKVYSIFYAEICDKEKNLYSIFLQLDFLSAGICLQTPQLCEDSNTLGSIENDPHLRR